MSNAKRSLNHHRTGLVSTRVVAFGDSITRGHSVPEGSGWVEQLALCARERDQDLEVINAGGNGNTSREGLQRLAEDVLPFLPATVLIEFGGNDPVDEGERFVSVEEFRGNLEIIIAEVRSKGGECVLITFPSIIDEKHFTAADPRIVSQGGLDNVVEAYRVEVRQFAAREECPLIDFGLLTRDWIEKYGPEAIIAPDGIHWTIETNRYAAKEVCNFLADGWK